MSSLYKCVNYDLNNYPSDKQCKACFSARPRKKQAIKWDEKSEKLVNGYIHCMQTDTFFIPDEIIMICLLYFFQFFDEWDTKNVSELALIENNFVSNKKPPDADDPNVFIYPERFSTFGVHQFNKGIHEWNFKIHELNDINQHWLYFGIATSTKYKQGWFGDRILDHHDNYYSYAFGVSAWVADVGVICNPIYENDIKNFNWYQGDQVCMTLDLKAKTLKYQRNGIEVMVIDNVYNDFEHKPDVKYRMANNIGTRSGFVKIELVSYQCFSLS